MSRLTKIETRRPFPRNNALRLAVCLLLLCAGLIADNPAAAGEADIVDVKVSKTAKHEYRFDVTVRHSDTGWKHYADRWEVLGPDDKVLGVRVLYHPHVGEQPFTRSLSGVKIPAEIDRVTLRAGDKLHKFGGRTKSVPLPK